MSFNVNIKQIYYSKQVLRIEYIYILLVSSIMFVAYYFVDLKSLTIWTTYFLDALFDGDLLQFYQYGVNNIYGAHHEYIGSNVFVFIPWAIWNIPIWILQRFFGIKILEHSSMLLWSKLFLVFALLLTSYFAYKIVSFSISEKYMAQLTVILTLASPFAFLGVYYAGQSDIISTAFFTAAIYALLKKKRALFYLLASCAIAVKPFYLLAYIAIILFLNKKIVSLIIRLVYGYGITLLVNLLYHNAPMYQESMKSGPTEDLINSILGHGYESFGTKASYLVFALVIIYFVAYIKEESKDNSERYIIYFTVVPLLLHFVFAGFQYYRLVILCPFIYIMYAQNKKYLRINLIINSIVSLCALLCISSYSTHMFSTKYMSGTFITNIFGKTEERLRNWVDIKEFFTSLTEVYPALAMAFAGAFGGGCFLLILLNYPDLKREYATLLNKPCERFIIWINMLVIVPFMMISFLCYYYV